MDGLLAASAAERRFALIVFEAFALVALVLAATGIYGVLSGSVTERMREIGVRSALGASRGDIVALVVRQAMTLTGLGVVIGPGWSGGGEPGADHAAVRGVAARSGYVSGRDGAAWERGGDGVRGCRRGARRGWIRRLALRME